ncbi:MAG: pyridoxamine 5'-phosphate oxidase family protein [Thermomicrobiales bacterium]
MRIDIADFEEIESDFLERIGRMVWCNAATVDRRGRPRSRILHPIWDRSTGWVASYPDSFKTRHLKANPHVSLAYIADISKPVYVECVATWERDSLAKVNAWNLFASTPEPLGYDPTFIFGSPDDPRFGLLRLKPWRIQLDDIPPGTKRIWTASQG